MTGIRETLIARQPILNRRHRITGYGLRFRSEQGRYGTGLDLAWESCARSIVEAFSTVGADKLLGPHLGFVTVTPEFLEGQTVEALPRDRVVLEIPTMREVSREFEGRCRELARRGFRLAVRDVTRRDAREPLLAHAKYAKLDLWSVKPAHLKQLLRRIKRFNVQVVAERVDSVDQLDECIEAGCNLFQGHYFVRPLTVAGRRVDPDRAVLMELLMKLGQDRDFDEIVETIKRSPGLTVNLLRLVNSGSLARATRIKSVPEALVLIGRNQLARWLTVLLYAGSEETHMEDAQLKYAAKRGRVVELLYKEVAGEEIDPVEADIAYLVGMLSLTDVLVGVPMERLLQQIQVDDEVGDALVRRQGLTGMLLLLEEKMEQAAFGEVEQLLGEVGLGAGQLAQAQLEAYAWVHGSHAPRFDL